MAHAHSDPPDTERIHCSDCGKPVSSPVPVGTTVRAWLECPECIKKRTPDPRIEAAFRAGFAACVHYQTDDGPAITEDGAWKEYSDAPH